MQERPIEGKYILHNDGWQVRIPPDLRRDLSHGSLAAEAQLKIMASDPTIGQRSVDDCVQRNFAENVRLRKVAHAASGILVGEAQSLGAEKFCTVLYGSLARGLVRKKETVAGEVDHGSEDSDIDLDLVIDCDVSKEDQGRVRSKMWSMSNHFGVRLDTYVIPLGKVFENKADQARVYLRSSAYSIHDTGGVWSNLRWVGLMSSLFLTLNKSSKRAILNALGMLSEGATFDRISAGFSERDGNDCIMFLGELGCISGNSSQKAFEMLKILKK